MTEKKSNAALVPVTSENLAALVPELFAPSALTLVDELVGIWVKRDAGDTIVGEITHMYSWVTENNDGESGIVRGVGIILRAPARVKGDDGDIIAPIGAVAGITLGNKLEALRYLRPGDLVAVTYLGEVRLPHARTTHRFRVRSSAAPRETPMPDGTAKREAAF